MKNSNILIAMFMAITAAASAVQAQVNGSQACQNICEYVDDCTTVTVCDQWVTDPGTGGLTDSHGNYRGRGVEFQKN